MPKQSDYGRLFFFYVRLMEMKNVIIEYDWKDVIFEFMAFVFVWCEKKSVQNEKLVDRLSDA